MALVVKDRVQVSTSTTGTGTLTLGAALGGFQDFSIIGNGNTTYYTITNNGSWEVGIGTYTSSGTTLSRDTVLASSNSGSKINLSGSSVVFCTYPADKSVDIETAQTLTNKTLTSPVLTNPTLGTPLSGTVTNLTGTASININGTVGATTPAAGRFTDLSFNSGYGSVATAYGCRAWVNFNGTGTIAIRASGNVTSITDNATGNYTINFTTAMPDTNYAFVGSGTAGGAMNAGIFAYNWDANNKTTSAVQIYTVSTNYTTVDANQVSAAIFR
jgi:hypothetical protein